MPSYSYLVPPVALATIGTPGELEAQVSQAVPGTNVGLVWYSATAPDVITYPELKRFMWVDTSGARIVHRHWNQATLSWETELPANNSITNDMLVGEITLDKLSTVGSVEGYIIRLVSGLIVWDDPSNMFTSGGFLYDDAAMKLPASAGSWVQFSNGTTTGWTDFPTLFGTQTLAINRFSTAGALTLQALSYVGTTLGYNYVETLLRDNTTPLTKLAPGGALTIPRTNAANTALEWVTSITIAAAGKTGVLTKFTTAELSIPAAAGAISPQAHGLPGAPDLIIWSIVCKTAEAGFAINDVVPLTSVFRGSGSADDAIAPFIYRADATYLYMRRCSDATMLLTVDDDDTGAPTALTDANWRLKCTAIYFA